MQLQRDGATNNVARMILFSAILTLLTIAPVMGNDTDAIHHAEWTALKETNWWVQSVTRRHPCGGNTGKPWTGVVCEDGRIIKIDVSGKELSGSIPKEFKDLTEITELKLAHNHLEGAVPDLSTLTKLRTLDLSNNEFTSIGSLAGLTELQNIFLQDARFAGDVPAGVWELPKLRMIDMGGNFFSSGLPTKEPKVCQNYGCKLDDNPWDCTKKDIPEWAKTSEAQCFGYSGHTVFEEEVAVLKAFHLWEDDDPNLDDPCHKDANLHGVTCNQHGRVSGIDVKTHQHAASTKQTIIPDNIGDLIHLEALSLEDNHVAGNIPSSLATLKHLRRLELKDNKIQGVLPSFWGNMTLLQQLDLRNNLFTGTIDHSLWSLPNLETVKLGGNKFFGKLPKKKPINDPYMEIGHNYWTCPLPSWAKAWSEFENDKACVDKYPVGPPSKEQLRAVKDMKMWRSVVNSDNVCIDPEVRGLYCNSDGDVYKIIRLDEEFSGIIPPSIAYFESLQFLYLSHGHLSGTLPKEEFANLFNLEVLDLSGNSISGDLPNFGENSKLSIIRLPANHMNGFVSDEDLQKIYAMPNLEIFEIDQNKLILELDEEPPAELEMSFMPNLYTCPSPEWAEQFVVDFHGECYHHNSSAAVLGIAIGGIAGFIVVVGFVVFVLYRLGMSVRYAQLGENEVETETLFQNGVAVRVPRNL